MQERMNQITPGIVGLPIPKKAKRATHANIAISITLFMPYRLRKKGISKMQNASLTWDIDVSNVALLAAKDEAMVASELPWKLEMKGPAKLLVT